MLFTVTEKVTDTNLICQINSLPERNIAEFHRRKNEKKEY